MSKKSLFDVDPILCTLKQMQKEKGMVTRTSNQHRAVRIHPQIPIPVSLSSAIVARLVFVEKASVLFFVAVSPDPNSKLKPDKKKGNRKRNQQTKGVR